MKKARIEEISTERDIRPHAAVKLNGTVMQGLLDSGATISALGRDAYKTLHRCALTWKEFNGAVNTASGQAQGIEGYVDANVEFLGVQKRIRLYIVPTLSKELYLGVDFWLAFNLLPVIAELDAEPADPNIHELNREQKVQLDAVIALFPSSASEGLGKTTLLKHEINVGNTRPIKQRHYAVSPAVEKKMFDEVDRMLDLGVIEESKSAWSSPVTVVAKAGGKSRLCLDARQLNDATVKDAYPMPKIEMILSRLHETYYITSLDLKDAFWQIELDERAREMTAFTVPGRPLYHFKRMPFGLCNAAQSMCRLMDIVIPSVLRDCVFVYIDDLLVVSADFKTHIERLTTVANCLREANLTLNVEKSMFCRRFIKYLGHIVGNGQIKPDPDRVRCIVEFPTPVTVKQVRRFLGVTQWYQRYMSNYSATAAPITDLLKKANSFKWTPEAQKAFEKLKANLTSAPVLVHPDFSLPFYIQCDACITGVGGVLYQVIDGGEHPIAFMSKKLNAAQRNYSITELECLAAVLCIKKFRCYVEGMRFTVITDHASLKWLMSQKDLAGRLARWSLKLQGYDFTIEHRKGSANVVPDALSRIEALDDMVRPPIDLNSIEFDCAEYVKLRAEVEANVESLPDLEVRDSVVFRRMEPRTGNEVIDTATMWKIWVPEGLRQSTIADAHQPSLAAHGGSEKTIDLLRRWYYWPGLSKDVREFVSRCSICKETKANNQTLRPPMGRQFAVERPFQRFYIDLLGPYPRSKSGNTTILIVLDQLTKFVWLKALRKATAGAIVRYVEAEVFHVFGVPESMLSDNGVQFVSKEFRSLLSQYGVIHITTATHAPQANASERVNRSILAAIRSYVEKDQTTWDVHLSAISGALRNAVHSSTGYSPYFMVFGQHMTQHAAAYKILRSLQALPTGDIEVVPPDDFRHSINCQVRERLQQAHDRNQRTYNKRSREVVFSPGQEVFIRQFRQSDFAQNFNAKLGRMWKPARIVSRKGSAMYVVEDRQGGAIKVAYHAKDIRV